MARSTRRTRSATSGAQLLAADQEVEEPPISTTASGHFHRGQADWYQAQRQHTFHKHETATKQPETGCTHGGMSAHYSAAENTNIHARGASALLRNLRSGLARSGR